MLLNVALNEKSADNKIIWLFPIPAKPNETKIDIIDSAPTLIGKDLKSEFDRKFEYYKKLYFASQIFFIPSLFDLISSRNFFQNRSVNDVEVLQKVEKYGITSELINVKNKTDFIEYLKSHKIKFSDDFNKILDHYIGNDYLFVLSWLSNRSKFKTKSLESTNNFALEIFITFKTPKIFFPLKFTSIYKEAVIPINIYVMNFVTPEFFSEIIPFSRSEYYSTPNFIVSPELKNFFFNVNQFNELNYTKILINSDANNFVNDLWINKNTPIYITLISIFKDYLHIIFILLFAFNSCLSSLLAGKLIFNDSSKTQLFLLGLLNFLSSFAVFLGLLISIYNNHLISDDIDFKSSRKYMFFYFLLFVTLFFILSNVSFKIMQFIFNYS
ncbi:MAG: hypothetical protein GYA62_03275 [Bacteroidales bacterium]|nr:hypothetical protein [Bacteroidales bacterium]